MIPNASTLTDEYLMSWAAGFLDGEGCFIIEKRIYKHTTPSIFYAPKLSVHLRQDDADSIGFLQRAFGSSGYCYKRTPRKPSTFGSWSKPTIECVWRSMDHLRHVLPVLKTHPLLGRKARDFAIWAEATEVYLNPDMTSPEKQAILGRLRVELQKVKVYKDDGSRKALESYLGKENER